MQLTDFCVLKNTISYNVSFSKTLRQKITLNSWSLGPPFVFLLTLHWKYPNYWMRTHAPCIHSDIVSQYWFMNYDVFLDYK